MDHRDVFVADRHRELRALARELHRPDRADAAGSRGLRTRLGLALVRAGEALLSDAFRPAATA